mgnify:CR=1 FL=1
MVLLREEWGERESAQGSRKRLIIETPSYPVKSDRGSADQAFSCLACPPERGPGNHRIHHSPGTPGTFPSLAASLRDWRGAHYWGSPDHSELVLIRPPRPGRRERWLLHVALFGATLICSLGAGRRASRDGSILQWGTDPLAWIKAGLQFFVDFTSGSTEQILSGWTFAVPLLGILLIHELGHFVAARRYAVDASPRTSSAVPPTPVADWEPGCIPETALGGSGPAAASRHWSCRSLGRIRGCPGRPDLGIRDFPADSFGRGATGPHRTFCPGILRGWRIAPATGAARALLPRGYFDPARVSCVRGVGRELYYRAKPCCH